MKVDFVIPWVDGSDETWLKERNSYRTNNTEGVTANRYRDWENLKYLFRGIEKFAPWVNKVFFITWGHLPEWLNANCEKLVIVNHKDYIPEKYLPTFSSHPIELNMHRIKELSEYFVYFNDDFFITDNVSPETFFIKGLPVDSAIQTVISTSSFKDIFQAFLVNNAVLINKNFNKKEVIKKNIGKWINLKYGKWNVNNIFLSFWKGFSSFQFAHLPQPFLKSTLEEVWKKEEVILDEVSTHKFRQWTDVNQYIFRYWQYCKGNFYPGKPMVGKGYFPIDSEEVPDVIASQKYKMICLNDVNEDIDFELVKNRVIGAFENILPEKSMFEK